MHTPTYNLNLDKVNDNQNTIRIKKHGKNSDYNQSLN